MTTVISVCALVLSLAALVYAAHLAIVYQRFNNGIKDWASSLDNSTRDAISRAARDILRELDERVNKEKENNNEENEYKEDE